VGFNYRTWGDSWGNSWGNSWGTGGGGQTVEKFNGISTANGTIFHKGISRPTVALQDAGGGTYTVTISSSPSGKLKSDCINMETYLIDGELP